MLAGTTSLRSSLHSSYRHSEPDAAGEYRSSVEVEVEEVRGRSWEVPPPPQQRRYLSPQQNGGASDLSVASTSGGDSAQLQLRDVEEAASSVTPLPTDRYGFIQIEDDDGLPPKDSQPLPAAVIRKREAKWLEMLANWPHYMNTKFDKIRSRCRKGIPPSLRGRAWKYLSGAAFHMENSASCGVFEELDAAAGEAQWNEDIRKDLDRQFPEHELFSKAGPYGRSGQGDLFRLLKAYTVLHPEEGYCQGQAPVGAVLLMHLPLAEAFYVFVQICHKYVPGYYSPGLEHIQLDGAILQELLRHKLRPTYKLLKTHSVDPALYMIEWYMCVFCRTLPWATVLRVWDMFFCEGVKVLFKVALVLFKYVLGSKEQIRACPGMMEVVERLRRLPAHVTAEAFLVAKIEEVHVDERDLELAHHAVLRRREKARRKAEKDARKAAARS